LRSRPGRSVVPASRWYAATGAHFTPLVCLDIIEVQVVQESTSGSAPEDDDAIHSRGVAGGVHGPLGRRGAGRAAERPKLLREGIKVQVVQVTVNAVATKDVEAAFSGTDRRSVTHTFLWNGAGCRDLSPHVGLLIVYVQVVLSTQQAQSIVHISTEDVQTIVPDSSCMVPRRRRFATGQERCPGILLRVVEDQVVVEHAFTTVSAPDKESIFGIAPDQHEPRALCQRTAGRA